ncbi:MAG TPA: sensor histidine kinase [Terracidiphilus sp.]|nr:sensor histidine kinase [Terracidiphilus sp.]
MMSDRIREGTRIEQQRDRLVSLGKLSAGLAHELNNPASAAKRASDQMRDALARLRNANSELLRAPIDHSDIAKIEEVEASLPQSPTPIFEGLALGDQEEALESIIRRFGYAAPWELAASLARSNMPAATLTSLLNQLSPHIARPALVRIAASAELSSLLRTIENCVSRMSNLVRTIKGYTNMDQGPLQDVDVARALDTTLDALTHRLQTGIRVRREYEPVPLLVNTAGTDLNLVWTNIIENSIDALQGEGELFVRTFREDRFVVVEIRDNGPGIPDEIRPFIFDPFFTTKDVGQGTGLGLNTAQIIVRKHGGDIQVASKPGDTRFQVWLPWADAPGDPADS